MSGGLQLTTDTNGQITITLPNSTTLVINDLAGTGLSPTNQYHVYNGSTHVGYESGSVIPSSFFPRIGHFETTVDNVFMALRHKPAPNWLERLDDGKAIETGDVSIVSGLPGYNFGPVKHYVFEEHNLVVNVTMEGHTLYPGVVVRYLSTNDDGQIYLNTAGAGSGNFGTLNTAFSDPVTESEEELVVGDWVVGTSKDKFLATSDSNARIVIDGAIITGLFNASGYDVNYEIGDRIAIAPFVVGGNGADFISLGDKGGDGFGGAGDDVILGGKLDDWMFGGSGDDVLIAGGGPQHSDLNKA